MARTNCTILLLAFTTTGLAAAQPGEGGPTTSPDATAAAATPAPASQVKPEDEADVVVLKAGGFYRGVITDQKPGSHVTIRLPSGVVRTVPQDEIEFAGLFARRPGAVAAAPASTAPTLATGTPSGSSATVEWLGSADGVVLRLRSQVPDAAVWAAKVGANGADPDVNGWSRVCTMPCDVRLAKGVYRFAVASPNDDRVDVDDTIEIAGPATYVATVEHHTAQRVLGWVAFGVGITAGVSSVAALKGDGRLIGASLGFGSAVVGFAFGLRQDGAFLSPVDSNDATSASRSSSPGLSISGTF